MIISFDDQAKSQLEMIRTLRDSTQRAVNSCEDGLQSANEQIEKKIEPDANGNIALVGRVEAKGFRVKGHNAIGGYATASSPSGRTISSGTSFQTIGCYFDLTPGTYILSGSVSFNGNNTNRRSVQWERTTEGYESEYTHSRSTAHAGSTAAVRLNAVAIAVVPNDVESLRFELKAWQNSGDNALGVSAAARYVRIA